MMFVHPALGTGTNSTLRSSSTTVRCSRCWENGASVDVAITATTARVIARSWQPDAHSSSSPARAAAAPASSPASCSGSATRFPPRRCPPTTRTRAGYGESQWVVDFHTRLLERAKVQVADGRPAAWALTADAGLDSDVEEQLRAWLATQFKETDDIVIKDPRLAWFVPLWRRCGASIDASPRFIHTLRHPAAVAEDTWPADVSRTAAWLNQTLFTERATRDARRAFVGYDELVDDWTVAVGRLGEELDLDIVRSAAPPAMRRVHDFLDGVPRTSRTEWGDTRIPPALTELALQTWEHISGERPPEPLDAARRSYVELYEQAEAIAHSSVVGSRAGAEAAAEEHGRRSRPRHEGRADGPAGCASPRAGAVEAARARRVAALAVGERQLRH